MHAFYRERLCEIGGVNIVLSCMSSLTTVWTLFKESTNDCPDFFLEDDINCRVIVIWSELYAVMMMIMILMIIYTIHISASH